MFPYALVRVRRDPPSVRPFFRFFEPRFFCTDAYFLYRYIIAHGWLDRMSRPETVVATSKRSAAACVTPIRLLSGAGEGCTDRG